MRAFAYCLFLVGFLTTCLFAIPPVLNYAGQVAVNGEAFEGNGLFKFALVNDNGTSSYWSNDGTSVDGSEPQSWISVTVNGGLYSVLLGNTAIQGMGAIDPQVFVENIDAKLRVWFSDGVNGFQQVNPDRPFASVPYAFSAGNAETASSAEIANGAVTKSMLSSEVINDLDRKITMNDLDPAVIADLNDSVTDGSIGLSKLSSEVSNALKPVVVGQPNSVVEVAGTSAYLSVDATGGNNSYQWKKNGVDITGATNHTLSITDLNASQHEGNYTVMVRNAFGSATSSVAQIDVNGSLTEGLVGWWKFDETDGTIAYDSSGIGNDGNLTNGPTWVEGKIGGALNFDGVNDFVQISNMQSFFSNAASFTTWVKVLSYSLANEQGLAVFGVGQNLHYPYSGNSQLYVNILRSINRVSYIQTTVNFSDWHHVSITTQNNGYWVMYHNSSQISRVDAEPLSLPNNKSFGRSVYDSSFRYLNGLLDDVRIYDRALSAVEVRALYELGEQPVQEGGSGTTTVVNGTVADGSITTNQLSEQILKYLKPEITQQPIAGTIFADTNGTISVSTEGKYLSYQWKKDGVDLSGETNATLTITEANATQHDGNYSVIVSNDFGSVESGELEMLISNWVPRSSENLEIWLDATDESTIVQSSNLVSLWKDKSNSGNDASQNTTTYQPTYSPNGMGGFPSLKFDSDKMQFSNNNLLNKMCFVVIKPISFSNDDAQILSSYSTNVQLRIDQSSNAFSYFQYAADSSIYLGSTLAQNSITVNEISVLGFIFDQTYGSSIDGIFEDSQINRNSSGNSTYNQIGMRGGNMDPYNGYCGEIIIINSVDDLVRQRLEGYLAHKWGVESKLPSNHPYKNSAP